MKRIIKVLLISLLIITLYGCSSVSGGTWQEHYDLGIKYLADGKYEEAILEFTAAIKIDDKQVPAYIGRGDAYIGSGETTDNLEAALGDYIQAISLDEYFAQSYLKAYDAYIRLGQFEKAEEILKKGYEKTGDSVIKNKITEFEKGTIRDDSGKVRRESGFDGSGTLIYYIDYSYDINGRYATATSYDKNRKKTGEVTCKYDENGNQIVGFYRSYQGNNSVIIGKIENEYNGKGQITKSFWYVLDSTKLQQYEILKYDKNGNLIEDTYYSADGKIIQKTVSEYDKDGNIIHMRTDKDSGRTYEIAEYRDGRCIETKEYYSQDDTLLVHHKFLYDDEGRQVEWRTYDNHEKLIGLIETEYDDKGKECRTIYYDGNGEIEKIVEY
ncbi:MAG: tetratricopeptide repeat protein [Anaerovoracaceae bacterium]